MQLAGQKGWRTFGVSAVIFDTRWTFLLQNVLPITISLPDIFLNSKTLTVHFVWRARNPSPEILKMSEKTFLEFCVS